MEKYDLRLEPGNDRLWRIFMDGHLAGTCTRLMTGYLVEPTEGLIVKRFRRSDALRDVFGEAEFSIEEPADPYKEEGFA